LFKYQHATASWFISLNKSNQKGALFTQNIKLDGEIVEEISAYTTGRSLTLALP